MGMFFRGCVGFGSHCHAARSSFDVPVWSQVFCWASFFFHPSLQVLAHTELHGPLSLAPHHLVVVLILSNPNGPTGFSFSEINQYFPQYTPYPKMAYILKLWWEMIFKQLPPQQIHNKKPQFWKSRQLPIWCVMIITPLDLCVSQKQHFALHNNSLW